MNTDGAILKDIAAQIARIERLEAAAAAAPPAKMISYAELVARHHAKRNR
jgi:hypothetical protein